MDDVLIAQRELYDRPPPLCLTLLPSPSTSVTVGPPRPCRTRRMCTKSLCRPHSLTAPRSCPRVYTSGGLVLGSRNVGWLLGARTVFILQQTCYGCVTLVRLILCTLIPCGTVLATLFERFQSYVLTHKQPHTFRQMHT